MSRTPLPHVAEPVDDDLVLPRDTVLYVDLAAIRKNIAFLKHRAQHFMLEHGKTTSALPQMAMMAMVKGDGYGSGMVRVAQFMNTIPELDFIGVARVVEGARIFQAVPDLQKDLFAVSVAPYEIPVALKYNFVSGCGSASYLRELHRVATSLGVKGPIRFHLHVDTGMTRLGAMAAKKEHIEILTAYKELQGMEEAGGAKLVLEGIFTHHTSAEDAAEDAWTATQYTELAKVIAECEDFMGEGFRFKYRHAANSATSLRHDEHIGVINANLMRIGLSTFGMYSAPVCKQHADAATIPAGIPRALSPIYTLHSAIVHLHEQCEVGSTVSYNKTFTIRDKPADIAVVPLGYHDGLRRYGSAEGARLPVFHVHVAATGQYIPCPLTGVINMDFLMIDVTEAKGVAVGDTVVVFGWTPDGSQFLLTLEEFIAGCGMGTPYQFSAGLCPNRIHREYLVE